ncbi:MAG: response regulator [Nannocystis sp.]|nr:hybrid sensor histidine kinase/response regulator [Nannocystis sp.]MBA3547188.1 response regulator [Nannocystis sp.]
MRPRISILLVEDDEDDFILTQALLSEQGGSECTLVWAQSFEEGLRQLVEGPFDVCLLDYSLGERTGMELLTKSVAAGVDVPIIFLTGQTERALDIEATYSGAADYLVKGRITADLLERSIRYAMERGRSLSTLRQLNRELELTRNQAIQANRAKSGFLTAVSHSYREPLDQILACSEALRQHIVEGPPEALLQEIREAGQRLRTLLSDVLGMGAREIETSALNLRHVEIGPFIREVTEAIRPLVGHNNNTLQLNCPVDIGSLETDPAHLGRVLLNLLGNVCKFTRRGCIELTVSRHPAQRSDLDAEGSSEAPEWMDYIELAIRASGLWLSPAQLELLFASISQAETGDMPRSGGVESGIAGSRRICQLLGGKLYVETEGPRRPVLRVCLPARRGAHPLGADGQAGIAVAPTDSAL